MNYEQVQKLNPADFKRYCGLHQETFKEMVKIVKAEKVFQKKSGRPSKLCVEDQILMTLLIRTEKALINSGLFKLPGKKIFIKVKMR
jgi:hypothetical protein